MASQLIFPKSDDQRAIRKPKWRRRIAVIAFAILLLLSLKVIFLPSGGPRIVCHRAVLGAFETWMKERGNTAAWPNIDGKSLKSLKAIEPFWGSQIESDFHDYVYIPGLQADDPGDLVLLYVKQKSRRKWHGDAPTIFREQKWIVIDPTFNEGNGELNDWITADELKNRIHKTLDYLKTKNRSNWESILAEQKKFLESIHN